jgi:hypothetical protein
MSFSEWVSRKFSARSSGQGPAKRGRRKLKRNRRRCIGIEWLEPRQMPSVIHNPMNSDGSRADGTSAGMGTWTELLFVFELSWDKRVRCD